jgi:hypothetical protein
VRQQAGALGGQPHAPRQPVEQSRTDGPFQRRDLAGHRRLRVPEDRGGAGQRSVHRHFPEDSEPGHVHSRSLCVFGMPTMPNIQ